GGPNYVAQLMRFEAVPHATYESVGNEFLARLLRDLREFDAELSGDFERIAVAVADYDRVAQEEFLVEHDHFKLLGQDNIRRYLAVEPICVRVCEQDSPFDIVARVAAARAANSRVVVSAAPGVHEATLRRLHDVTESWAADIEFLDQSDEELVDTAEAGGFRRFRFAAAERVPAELRRAVIGRSVHIADDAVLPVGRVELCWYVEEQSISYDYHRYGNLGARAAEERAPVH
ncbi:MAG: proline dehydrogenase, partial [Planctomycetota bacterium]